MAPCASGMAPRQPGSTAVSAPGASLGTHGFSQGSHLMATPGRTSALEDTSVWLGDFQHGRSGLASWCHPLKSDADKRAFNHRAAMEW